MTPDAAVRTLLTLYAEHRLTARDLIHTLWTQGVWPWTPPGQPIAHEHLAEAVVDYRAALDVQTLVALEVLDDALRTAGPPRCHRDAPARVCLVCEQVETARQAAVEVAAGLVAT